MRLLLEVTHRPYHLSKLDRSLSKFTMNIVCSEPAICCARVYDYTRCVAEEADLLFSRWNNPQNVYRTTWSTKNIPALVRYQQVNGEVTETGRLVEGEILNKERLRAFIA